MHIDIKKAYYVIHTVYLIHVSATLVVILREVQYKGKIYRDITKLCELKQICTILSFNNTWFKKQNKTNNTDKNCH
jgi:hypothetical protein